MFMYLFGLACDRRARIRIASINGMQFQYSRCVYISAYTEPRYLPRRGGNRSRAPMPDSDAAPPAAPAMLVVGGCVCTMDGERRVLNPGAVLVIGGRIAAVGTVRWGTEGQKLCAASSLSLALFDD
eukprot:SAG31_NODE_16649_length_701_cov_1.360465_1_plen_126_part_00